jgi:hypothetical protein
MASYMTIGLGAEWYDEGECGMRVGGGRGEIEFTRRPERSSNFRPPLITTSISHFGDSRRRAVCLIIGEEMALMLEANLFKRGYMR